MEKTLAEKKVSEAMSRGVYSVNLNHTWAAAARKMIIKQVHHLVVVDENHDPVGIISSFDFLPQSLNIDRASIPRTKLRDVRPKRSPISIGEDETLAEAANKLDTHHIDCLIVLNEKKQLIGIITSKDIMNAMFEDHLEMV